MAQGVRGRSDRSPVARPMPRPSRTQPVHRAPVTPSAQTARLDRCAGACSCGGTCAGAKPAEDELGALLRSSVLQRATLQRDLIDDIKPSAEKQVQEICAALNTANGSPLPCAKSKKPGAPSGFCVPLGSKLQAMAIRNVVKAPLLLGIRTKVNPRVVGFWDEYMGSVLGVGGDPSVRDLTSSFGADFAKSPTTDATSSFLEFELAKDLTTNGPSVAPGTSVSLDITKRIPAAVAEINTPDAPNEMNFSFPSDIGGNLAGGIGKDEASCRVGAHPSPQDDARIVTGTVKVTGMADGSRVAEPDLNFEVRDTIDLCPGDFGTGLEQCATVILSRLEASGVAGDIPFKVKFSPPKRAPLLISPVPVPPVPPKPGPSGQLSCPRFLRADGTPEPTLQACLENKKRLAAGARGEPVRMVQEALIALKFDLGSFGADAKFGNDTAKAVMAFKKQQKLGFETIGDVGPGTMARLDKLCP
jgi:hypothetical protein